MTHDTYRVGRHLGRTIYRRTDGEDQLIGLMDTPELGQQVVDALNASAPAANVLADRYHRRPQAVRARQWRGDNETEIRALVGPAFNALDEPCDDDPTATAELLTDPHSTWTLMYVGDWAVLHERGAAVTRMANEQFRAEYEPADGSTP